jgi:CRP/FNR family nitrogen fixation transcriptional regulator
MLLLGRKNALESVANFLLEMDRSLAVAGMMALRRDIGDYLRPTLEIVSRALMQLRREVCSRNCKVRCARIFPD